jgi:hypothetical protein
MRIICLCELPNIQLLGVRIADEVSDCVRSFDVAIKFALENGPAGLH